MSFIKIWHTFILQSCDRHRQSCIPYWQCISESFLGKFFYHGSSDDPRNYCAGGSTLMLPPSQLPLLRGASCRWWQHHCTCYRPNQNCPRFIVHADTCTKLWHKQKKKRQNRPKHKKPSCLSMHRSTSGRAHAAPNANAKCGPCRRSSTQCQQWEGRKKKKKKNCWRHYKTDRQGKCGNEQKTATSATVVC